MNPLDQELNTLIEQARQHPQESIARKRILNRVAAKIQNSGRLLQIDRHQPDYQDAVMLMWVYFMNNVCEATTAASAYDPMKVRDGSVITWLNSYLGFRLKDARIDRYEKEKTSAWGTFDRASGTISNPIDDISTQDSDDISESEIIQILRQWIQGDPEQTLSQCYPKGNPLASCKTLIQRRLLPPETAWKDLAQELNVPLKTLESHFKRHCLKLLQAFCKAQGFYD
jgi:hypothetical protein